MQEYIVYSGEGFTQDALGEEVQNLQILGFYQAENKADAIRQSLEDFDEDAFPLRIAILVMHDAIRND